MKQLTKKGIQNGFASIITNEYVQMHNFLRTVPKALRTRRRRRKNKKDNELSLLVASYLDKLKQSLDLERIPLLHNKTLVTACTPSLISLLWIAKDANKTSSGGHITRTSLFKYTEKFYHQKYESFQMKNSKIFHISVQNINCEYSLEPPRRGGSNEYPQSMF